MKKLLIFLSIFSINLMPFLPCFAAVDDGLDGSYVAACYDLEIIFARGSGGAHNDTDEFRAVSAAAEKITKEYMLATVAYDLNYPAIAVDALPQQLGAFVSAGKAYAFGDSVRSGVTMLKAYYAKRHKDCPDQKFALVGYSQGAIVVADTASTFADEDLKFILMLGDPHTYLPEGEGLFPEACNGGKLSQYRTRVPNCRTASGILGARKPYEIGPHEGKFSLWCNREDYICGSSKNPFKNSEHTIYASSGEIASAMDHLADKYLEKYTPSNVRPLRMMSAKDSLVDDGDGADIEAPSDVVIWRDGDVIKMKWQAPEEAENLLVRFDGIDLGYVDAERGELEIRDVDMNQDYRLGLAWMDSTGELGELEERKSAEISDEAPMFIDDDVDTDANTNESADSPAEAGDGVTTFLPESIKTTTPIDSGLVLSSYDIVRPQFMSEVQESEVVGDDSDTDDNVDADDNLAILSKNVEKPSGLKFSEKSSIVNIVLSMLGASGLLLTFVIKKRRGG